MASPPVPTRPLTSGARALRRLGIAVLTTVALLSFGTVGPVTAQPDAPRLSVEPSSGPGGTALSIAGFHFAGDTFVDLSLAVGTSDDRFLGRLPVDADGHFVTDELTVALDAAGGHYEIVAHGCVLVVNGDTRCVPSNNRATAPFEVTSDLAPRYTPAKPVYGEGLPDFVSRTEAHLKFVQGSGVRLVGPDDTLPFGFAGGAANPSQNDEDELAAINSLLQSHTADATRLFANRSSADYDRERARQERASGREIGDKNLYYLLTYAESTDAAGLLDSLNAFDIVEIAYADPLPGEEPTNHSADYIGFQGYRTGGPGGINADAASHLPGGRGHNVRVTDIERFFNPDHEDLPPVDVVPNGDVDAQWPNDAFDHGTAVMGQLFGQDNGFGVLGLVDLAEAAFVTTAGGRPQAIDIAHNSSAPGDVILLELQRVGPNGGCTQNNQTGCAPEEWVQASYDAVVAAVADGIIIVAAAGNGRQDLDGAEYQDWLDRGDSGAIIVGAAAADFDAGVAPRNPACNANDPAPARSRLDFSNFGSRVDLHAWGQCVTTTGYGGLNGVAAGADDAYTGTFGGTSSASPIVAAAAAIVSSVHQEQGLPAPTSTEVRSILVSTGTPQLLPADDPDARDGNIGPLPDLAAALGLSADLTVTKSADPDPVAAGTNVVYEVSVTNSGPNVAVHVELVDTLPAEVAYITDDQGCTHSAGVVTCDVGTLGVNDDFTVEIVAAVPANLVHSHGGPLTITNTATATSSLADSNPADNTAEADTLVVAVADLEMVGVEVLSGVPTEQLIGTDIAVTVRSVVRNNGPSSPMNATLTTDPTPSAGAAVVPVSDATPVTALTPASRAVDQLFTIRCEAPGPQQVVFDVEIGPAGPADTDPDLTNNTGQVTVEVDCIVPIAINIRPGNQFNRVNVNSNAAIPVAALTTEAGEYGLPVAFDATQIIPTTVQFGSSDQLVVSGASPLNGLFHVQDSFELDDRTRDGDLDMWFLFVTPATGIATGDSQACMRGQYLSGGDTFAFFGCDFVAT